MNVEGQTEKTDVLSSNGVFVEALFAYSIRHQDGNRL